MKNHSFLKYCTSILLIFIAVACTTGNKEQKIVTVTIQPQKYFAEKIAGDRFNINCIVPPGSNPEAYDPLSVSSGSIWAKVSPISKSGT